MHKFVFTTMFLAFFTIVVGQNKMESGDYRDYPAADTTAGDYFFFGGQLIFNGVGNSDLFAFARTITINGKSGDDLFSMGQQVAVNGQIGGNAYLSGREVNIDGEVNGDIFAGAGNVTLGNSAVINGNVRIGAGEVFIAPGATIRGNLYVGSGAAKLNGSVGGETHIGTEYVSFGENFTSADSVFLSISEDEPHEISNAPGNMRITYVDDHDYGEAGFFVWMLISALIIAAIIQALFPRLRSALLTAGKNGWPAVFGIGAAITILTPAVIILSLLILPAAMVLSGLYFSALYLGLLLGAIALGDLVLPHGWSKWLRMLASITVLWLLMQIPFIGFFISLALTIFGIGLLTRILQIKQSE
jgi:cytoskeletal protein CcmA (bactofilin family)